jgi:hypothetical protein
MDAGCQWGCNFYLYALFHRVAGRRGKKRAVIAVADAILIIVCHMLKGGSHYRGLGHDYFDRLNRDAVSRRLVRRLEWLGYQVEIKDLEVGRLTGPGYTDFLGRRHRRYSSTGRGN